MAHLYHFVLDNVELVMSEDRVSNCELILLRADKILADPFQKYYEHSFPTRLQYQRGENHYIL